MSYEIQSEGRSITLTCTPTVVRIIGWSLATIAVLLGVWVVFRPNKTTQLEWVLVAVVFVAFFLMGLWMIFKPRTMAVFDRERGVLTMRQERPLVGATVEEVPFSDVSFAGIAHRPGSVFLALFGGGAESFSPEIQLRSGRVVGLGLDVTRRDEIDGYLNRITTECGIARATDREV